MIFYWIGHLSRLFKTKKIEAGRRGLFVMCCWLTPPCKFSCFTITFFVLYIMIISTFRQNTEKLLIPCVEQETYNVDIYRDALRSLLLQHRLQGVTSLHAGLPGCAALLPVEAHRRELFFNLKIEKWDTAVTDIVVESDYSCFDRSVKIERSLTVQVSGKVPLTDAGKELVERTYTLEGERALLAQHLYDTLQGNGPCASVSHTSQARQQRIVDEL